MPGAQKNALRHHDSRVTTTAVRGSRVACGARDSGQQGWTMMARNDMPQQQAIPRAVGVNSPARQVVIAPRQALRMQQQQHPDSPERQQQPPADDVVSAIQARARDAELATRMRHVEWRARREQELARGPVTAWHTMLLDWERRALDAENSLKLANERLAEEQMAADVLVGFLELEAAAKKQEEERSEGLHKLVEALLRTRREADAWADEPADDTGARAVLLPGGSDAGPPRFSDMEARWTPGILRQIGMEERRGACACAREMAANGLSSGQERFDNTEVLGEGSFGVVYNGLCKKMRKRFAVKRVKPGLDPTGLIRELMAYTIMKQHKNIISVFCVNDLPGSEGVVMEVALCDLCTVVLGRSDIGFTLAQQIGFEADAAEGLAYMHGLGLVHCDHKMQNTLICLSDGPERFIGKLTDPGLCCGSGEMKGWRMGTVGRVPPENFDRAVEAAPDHDTFAVGADLCFMLARPDLMNEDVNMFTHSSVMTASEKERLARLQLDGGDTNEFWEDVTARTMGDRSFSRIFLRPVNLNPALPHSELRHICEVLKNAISPTPWERQEMTTMMRFLRELAASTAALPEEDSTSGSSVGARSVEDNRDEGSVESTGSNAALDGHLDSDRDSDDSLLPAVPLSEAEEEEEEEVEAIPVPVGEAVGEEGTSPILSAQSFSEDGSDGDEVLASLDELLGINTDTIPAVAPSSIAVVEERENGISSNRSGDGGEAHGTMARGRMSARRPTTEPRVDGSNYVDAPSLRETFRRSGVASLPAAGHFLAPSSVGARPMGPVSNAGGDCVHTAPVRFVGPPVEEPRDGADMLSFGSDDDDDEGEVTIGTGVTASLPPSADSLSQDPSGSDNGASMVSSSERGAGQWIGIGSFLPFERPFAERRGGGEALPALGDVLDRGYIAPHPATGVAGGAVALPPRPPPGFSGVAGARVKGEGGGGSVALLTPSAFGLVEATGRR